MLRSYAYIFLWLLFVIYPTHTSANYLANKQVDSLLIELNNQAFITGIYTPMYQAWRTLDIPEGTEKQIQNQVFNAYYILSNTIKKVPDEDIKTILNFLKDQLTFQNPELHCLIQSAIAKGHFLLRQYDAAKSNAFQAISLSSIGNDIDLKIESRLIAAEILINNMEFSNAYTQLLTAENLIIENHLDESKLEKLYNLKAKLFSYIQDPGEALKWKRKAYSISSTDNNNPYLSKWYEFEFMVLNVENKDTSLVEEKLKELYNFSIEHKFYNLKNSLLTYYRSFLVTKNDLDKLAQFHLNNPDELHELKNLQPFKYYVQKAYIAEYRDSIEAAKNYFNIAHKEVLKTHDYHLIVNFLLRKGEFYMRINESDIAKELLANTLDKSKDLNFTIIQNRIYQNLIKIFESMNDYEKTNYYLKEMIENGKKISDNNQKNKLIQKELESQKLILDKIKLIEDQETSKSHNFQLILIGCIVIAMFLIFSFIASMPIKAWIIELAGFIVVLMVFEFIILWGDLYLHKIFHGAPVLTYAFKILAISVLYPLHHLIEHNLVHFFKKNNLISKKDLNFYGLTKKLWPFIFKKESDERNQTNVE